MGRMMSSSGQKRWGKIGGVIGVVVLALLIFQISKCSVSVNVSPQEVHFTELSPEDGLLARKAAQDFLSMVDEGNFDLTWDMASASLRSSSSKTAWTAITKAARLYLGADPLTRVQKFAALTEDLPNAPPGKYAVMVYASGKGNEETVVLESEEREWKIAGYHIKRRLININTSS